MKETVWICVYRDTIEEHEDNNNLTEVQVTKEFARSQDLTQEQIIEYMI